VTAPGNAAIPFSVRAARRLPRSRFLPVQPDSSGSRATLRPISMSGAPPAAIRRLLFTSVCRSRRRTFPRVRHL
jgi:hypothetical protein